MPQLTVSHLNNVFVKKTTKMGNHHGHSSDNKSGRSTPTENNSNNGHRKSISRTVSGNDIQEKQCSQLLPLEKLAKILTDKSIAEEGVQGITFTIFTKYLFPRYPLLAEKLYSYLHKQSKAKTDYIGTTAFKQQCEKFLAILDDDTIRSLLVNLFSKHDDESESSTIDPESMRSMLMCAYHISMDHYSEGPQMCFSIGKTLKAVVDGCFHTKTSLSSNYVSHWLKDNCPRLLLPLHRFIIHSLATSYRTLEESGPSLAAGLELATPVLEKASPFELGKPPHPHLLHMSMSWLLASALPSAYSRPQRAHSPSSSGTGISSALFLSKLMCAVPSHWILLYDSDQNGLGSNRFLHHTLNYKGPTLVLLKTEDGHLFCVASPDEWKESNHYWGGAEAAVLQLYPKFVLLETGPKMLYLNLSVRGYPMGLRAGSDPRAPLVSIDGSFEKVEFQKIPYSLVTIEVWGCGDAISRDKQLDIKKWEVKEAERQRNVKLSAAEWMDHPDRYLLELAGRPQYNQN